MESIEIKLRYRKYKVKLILDNKITVIMGLSATGKSTIHKVLEVKDVTKTVKISDSRYSIRYLSDRQLVDQLSNGIKLHPYFVYIIDEGRFSIDNEVASIIQRSINCYFIITARTNLGKLNFAINAVKYLATNTDGVTYLDDYLKLQEQTKDELRHSRIDKFVIEDSGKAKEWFNGLFSKLGRQFETPKEGKEKMCEYVETQFTQGYDNVLAVFDECSFGPCIKSLKYLVETYPNRLTILSKYKSWEYLILKTNMFKDKMVEYSIDSEGFEEAYYENMLQKLSKEAGKRTHIKHDSSKQYLSKCYIEPCCYYNGKLRECSIGLSGNDKFIAMLQGTEFENILIIAGREPI